MLVYYILQNCAFEHTHTYLNTVSYIILNNIIDNAVAKEMITNAISDKLRAVANVQLCAQY